MSKTMTLPKIGVNMTEVIVAEWLVKPGDLIKAGDAIFIGETDKAAQDILATDSGIVGKLLVEEGSKVQVNEPILVLLEEGGETVEEKSEKDIKSLQEEIPSREEHIKEKLEANNVSHIKDERIRISPLAKKIAEESNIDISKIVPGKKGKRIVREDILAYKSKMGTGIATEHIPEPNIDEDDVLEMLPMTNVRKVIARRMSESNLEKPCAALTLSAGADEIIRLRNRYKERGIKVSYNDILVKIVSKVLTENRIINSVLDGENIKLMRHVNIGVAIDTDNGLMVPVIKDADRKSLLEISADLDDKIKSVRDKKINSDDLTGGTFTITNLGMFEIEQFTPIINPPECCILAVGAMKKEFVPDESNQPMLITTMKLTLVFDHRIVDGAPAAKFLQSIKHHLEYPEMLI
ncbi:MAG: 2-oxo acid dehydrogenase subunit E2 [Clostridia bacterium]|nr:2-oxo acid dehydrogenase subunit E2 [Clostridia bacterium]